MKTEMTFQQILQNKFQLRVEKNKKYSLRTFAKDLGISSSLLSYVLNGKKGLSPSSASMIAKNLGLSELEQSYFCDLVSSAHARNQGSRILAKDRIENYKPVQIKSLTVDSFSLIHEWHHFALLELTHTSGFQSTVEYASNILRVPQDKIKTSVERLINMGLMEISKEGKWIDTQADLATPDGFSLSYLRKFHKQLIEKALQALEEQTIERRDITSLLVSIDSERIPEAKKRIRAFKKEFIKDFNQTKEKKDSVYCLGIQLFDLTQKEHL